jgi:hypothetical protein
VTIELVEGILIGPGQHHGTAVFFVPGRELEIFVHDLVNPKRLEMFVFGLES